MNIVKESGVSPDDRRFEEISLKLFPEASKD